MDGNQALQVVATYLGKLYTIYTAGTGMTEAAYYPPLTDLLNEVGRTLQPQVLCLLHFKNIRPTLPDGGLFTAEQFPSPADYQTLPRTPPARGVVVVKGPGDDLEEVASSQLIARYLKKYDQVLLTNCRAFLWMRPEPQGRGAVMQMGYILAGNEAEFWAQLAQPQPLAARHGPALVTYLKQVLWGETVGEEPQVLASPSQAAAKEDTRDEILPIEQEPDPRLSLPPAEYFSWPQLPELFSTYIPAIKTGREVDLADLDLRRLERRLGTYFDASLTEEAVSQTLPALMVSGKDYEAPAVRRQLLSQGLASGVFIRYAYRPFDLRHFYAHPKSKLLEARQKVLLVLAQANNPMLISRKKPGKEKEGVPLYFASTLVDRHLARSGAVCFPVTLKGRLQPQQSLFESLPDHIPTNLSALAHKYLLKIGISAPDVDEETAGLLAFHVLAMSYSPRYFLENEDFLCHDWPRIPLPDQLPLIQKSAALGVQLAALLDPETTLPQVTGARQLRPDLKPVGVLMGVDEEDPEEPDLAVADVWSTPGQFETAIDQGYLVERDYTAPERSLIEKGAALLGLTLDQLDTALGLTTYDIYLNEQLYWANIPLRVWDYTIGGYQVLKEWLASRQENVLGRPLRLQEARNFTAIIRRLTAVVLLGPALDANYEAVKQAVISMTGDERD